jgi:hypothetical protein
MLPGKGLVSALAVAPAGNIYVAFTASPNAATPPSPNVAKLNPAGTATLCTIEVPEPRAIAMGEAESLYVVDSAGAPNKIRQFSSVCADKQEAFGEIDFSTGIATGGSACNNAVSIYISNEIPFGGEDDNSYIADYGPRPDSTIPGCEPPKIAPTIEAQYAPSVSTDGAVLEARINPHFWPDTTYYIEYGTAKCTESSCLQKPLAPGGLLADAADAGKAIGASGVLGGLQPGTTYHFRFVSQSSGGGPTYGIDPDGEGPEGATFEKGLEGTFTTFPAPNSLNVNCPNQGFRGGASGHLSNCRAYEMVSPVNKNGGDIAVLGRFSSPNYATGLYQSSSDGEKITYSSATAFGDSISAPFTSQYIATRKSRQEWSTHSVSPPRQGKSVSLIFGLRLDNEYKLFSDDLCQAWLQHDTDPALAAGAVEGVINLFSRDNCGIAADSYEALTTSEPPGLSPASKYWTEVQGVSKDGAKTFFTASERLTEDAASGKPQLYVASEGALRLVCVLPDGSPSGGSCTAGTNNTDVNDGRENSTTGAVSENGSRIYWSLISGASGPGKLYLRQNPDQEQSPIEGGECTEPEKACTVAVSSGTARFWAAASDGSTAIYSVGEKLFEYNAGEAASHPIAESVISVAGASKDTSRIYFASTKLQSGADENSEGDSAVAGQPNLYFYEKDEEGGEDTFGFVATITSKDLNSPLNPIAEIPVRRASRVSPDGLHLAFTSSASATGFDSTDRESGEADSEVFLYSAADDELDCVSCNPTGSRAVGRNYEIDGDPQGFWAAAYLPTWETQLYAPRALSDNGNRLFFNSYDALVPRDTNGMQDVYEWERSASAQGCVDVGGELFVASAGGCLSLISSGQSPVDSQFADASPNGRDVFFKTAASLLPQDPGLIDIYDAREFGGLPTPPIPNPPCEGEACQSPPPPPTEVTPSSTVFEGPGNLVPAKPKPTSCPKGKHKVKQKGKTRCVANKKGKSKKKGQANKSGRAGR